MMTANIWIIYFHSSYRSIKESAKYFLVTVSRAVASNMDLFMKFSSWRYRFQHGTLNPFYYAFISIYNASTKIVYAALN